MNIVAAYVLRTLHSRRNNRLTTKDIKTPIPPGMEGCKFCRSTGINGANIQGVINPIQCKKCSGTGIFNDKPCWDCKEGVFRELKGIEEPIPCEKCKGVGFRPTSVVQTIMNKQLSEQLAQLNWITVKM